MAKEYFDANALFEDSDFCDDFCRECPAIRRIPATLEEPEEVTCPADWDASCEECERHDDYESIIELGNELNADIARILN